MNREVAVKLLRLINNLEAMDALEEYIRLRVEFHRDQLESMNSETSRGSLSELRRFKTLRDEVLRYSKDDR